MATKALLFASVVSGVGASKRFLPTGVSVWCVGVGVDVRVVCVGVLLRLRFAGISLSTSLSSDLALLTGVFLPVGAAECVEGLSGLAYVCIQVVSFSSTGESLEEESNPCPGISAVDASDAPSDGVFVELRVI